ncbi:MAG: sigma-70 family RNA polymerase sigma factor [Planctomycetes bacterium]|nr:sigma-70 family RNA polymerase sigma factor [Planctomycetota bacterium]
MSSQELRGSDVRPITSVKRIKPTVIFPSADVVRGLHEIHVGLLRRRCLEPAECVYDSRFAHRDAEQSFLGDGFEHALADELAGPSARSCGGNDDSGMDLLAKGRRTCTSEQEVALFLRFNYCRYRVMRVLRDFRGRELTREGVCDLVRWELATRKLRATIIRANMPLVLAMVKRTRISSVDQAELISEGNLALLRSVDKFDCQRGFKFSTYACRSILKAFSRVASRTARYRGYFPTEFDPTLETSDVAEERRRGVEDECVTELRSVLGQNLAQLSEIERQVIVARFAIDETADNSLQAKAKTLEQVGELIGVTKERVRQIQNKALNKLRTILEENVLPS